MLDLTQLMGPAGDSYVHITVCQTACEMFQCQLTAATYLLARHGELQ